MKTTLTTKTTTNTNSISSITLSAKHAYSIRRLAKQIGRSPDFLIRKFIDNAIRTADSLLAFDCDPLKPILVSDFDCTKEMDALTPAEIADLEKNGESAQQELYLKDCTRRGWNIDLGS